MRTLVTEKIHSATPMASSLKKHKYSDEEEAKDSMATSKKRRAFSDDNDYDSDDDSSSLEEEVFSEEEPANRARSDDGDMSHPILRPKPDAHRMYAQDQVVIHTARM
jgi:hypothetical protein